MPKQKEIASHTKTSLKKNTAPIEAASQHIAEDTINTFPATLLSRQLTHKPRLSPNEVLQLQRTVGNQTVRRILANQPGRPLKHSKLVVERVFTTGEVVQRKIYPTWNLDHLKLVEVKKKIDEIQALPDQWAAADQLYAFSEFLFEIMGNELTYARAENKPKPPDLDKDQTAAWELLDYFDSPAVVAAVVDKPSPPPPTAKGKAKPKSKKIAAVPAALPPIVLDLTPELEALKEAKIWTERISNIELGYPKDQQATHKAKVSGSIFKALKTQITLAKGDSEKIQVAAKELSDLQKLLQAFQKKAAPAKKKLVEAAASEEVQRLEIVNFISEAMTGKFWLGLSSGLRTVIGTELKAGIEKGDWKAKLTALLGRKKNLKKQYDKEVESLEAKHAKIKALLKAIDEKDYIKEISFPADLANRIKELKKAANKDDWAPNIDNLNSERLEIEGLYADWLDNEFTSTDPAGPAPHLAANYFQEHIMVRHSFSSPAPNAGKFNSDEWSTIKGYIDTAKGAGTLTGPILNEEGGHPNGRFEIVHTFPGNIGTRINTNLTSRIKLIITRSGKSVVTAYPY